MDTIENCKPFGIILFARNFTSPADIKYLTTLFNEIDSDLHYLIDQEGGEKCRIEGEPYCPPCPWEMRKKSDKFVYQVYRDSAEALTELGITINLAPVADLGCGEYIKKRTFGTHPEETAGHMLSAIEGITAGGLIPCVKHFPGLGSSSLDPHENFISSDASIAEFEEKHWLPFRAAIEIGVPLIMTTHILAPALDAMFPATYSKKIISKIREFGFCGRILTDDLSMMRGAQKFPPEQRVSKALDAGHDVALWCEGN